MFPKNRFESLLAIFCLTAILALIATGGYAQPPIEAFFEASPTTGVMPLEVTFTNLSWNVDGWHWDFGDGNESDAWSPVHTFDLPGTYLVQLEVWNDTDTDAYGLPVTVSPLLPVALFETNIDLGVAPLQVSFTNLSQDADYWEWDYSDGDISYDWSPVHTFAAPGTYLVQLYVSNAWGMDLYASEITVLGDGLTVSPATSVAFSGYAGGPFVPTQGIYILANIGSAPLNWTLTPGAAWFRSPSSGTLPSGYSVDVTVTLTAAASALTPGDYTSLLTITNSSTGTVQQREVTLNVLPIPGTIDVVDTILPEDDRDMPFGELIIGNTRTENVTVTNTDSTHDLVVNDVIITGQYREDFSDGQAQDWVPSDPAAWSVEEEQYRIAASGYMSSTYSGQTWNDVSAEVAIEIASGTDIAPGIYVRATSDYVIFAAGSAYISLISDSGNLWVGQQVDGVAEWLYNAPCPFVNTGNTTNLLRLEVMGDAIQVFVNDNLAWSGNDNMVTEAGSIGLFAAFLAAPGVCNFDDINVNGSGGNGGVFSLGILPLLPLTLGPSDTFSFDVIFNPQETGLHEATVFIGSTDRDEPMVEVTLSGTAVEDSLVVTPPDNVVAVGPVGGPFSPNPIAYTLTNTGATAIDWTVTKDAGLTWADLSGMGGTLDAGGSDTVTLTLNTAIVEGLAADDYPGTLTFTNIASGEVHLREVHLEVLPLHHFVWEAVPSPQQVNAPFTTTINAVDTLGNTVTTYNGSAALMGVTEATKEIGTGTETWTYPLQTFWHDSRTQVIYLQSEVGGATLLNGLALDVTTLPGQALGNWTIRMKHTTMATHSPAAWEGPASGWTTVYQADTTISATGWVWFDFTTPFDYDGVSNLLIDFSHNNTSYTTSGSVRYSTGAAGRSLYGRSDSALGDPPNWTGTSNPTPIISSNVPNIRLSVGGPVAILPAAPVTFTNGTWTGEITVLEAADQMFLRATDGSLQGNSNRFDSIDMMTVLPEEEYETSGPEGGPFSPDATVYTLTNTGTTAIDWTVAKDAD
jgi:PKD repeat protein